MTAIDRLDYITQAGFPEEPKTDIEIEREAARKVNVWLTETRLDLRISLQRQNALRVRCQQLERQLMIAKNELDNAIANMNAAFIQEHQNRSELYRRSNLMLAATREATVPRWIPCAHCKAIAKIIKNFL